VTVTLCCVIIKGVMAKRIIFTVILLIIGGGAFFLGVYTFGVANPSQDQDVLPAEKDGDDIDAPVIRNKGPVLSLLFPDMEAEKGVQKELTEKSREVLGVWAVLKVINGVINVLQSAQVGGSFFVEASINPLQFLSPVDNVLDKLSNILLWALSAIIFEKILLAISGYIVFLIVIPLCALVSIITLWTSKEKSKVHKIIIVSVLISLIIPFAIPISFQVSTLLENKILTNNVGSLLESIQEKNKTAAGMEKDVTGLTRIGRNIINYMTNAKNLGNALIEDIINYFILFVFTNIVIPILTIIGLFFLVRYFAKLILA